VHVPGRLRPGEPPGRVAVVDIGTNTVLCTALFAEPRAPRLLRIAEDLHFVTGLGRSRGPDGSLNPAGQDRALRALRHVAGRLVSMGIATSSVRAAATSACREAPNGPAFLARVREELGLPAVVIDGAREADLVSLAQRRSFPDLPVQLALDIGGGSTELALSGHGRGWAVSIPCGATRLAEALGPTPELEAVLGLVRRNLEAVTLGEVPDEAFLIGVSGTATTAVQALDESPLWDPSRLHGRTLSRRDVQGLAARLLGMAPSARRRLPGVHPGRADAIGPALVWLAEIMAAVGRDELTVSDRGVRFGLLFEAWPRTVVRS
jgi:exopolyphosphatase/guanosine-5'-triphosphate,3'-diphosphate pyrophosphatase